MVIARNSFIFINFLLMLLIKAVSLSETIYLTFIFLLLSCEIILIIESNILSYKSSFFLFAYIYNPAIFSQHIISSYINIKSWSNLSGW